MNIQFSQKVKGAMERAAYDELITRSNGLPYVSMDSSSTKKIDDIPAGNIKAITIDKRKGANTVHIQTNDALHSKVYIFQMRYDLQKQNFKLESYDTLLSKNLEDAGITSPYRLSLIDRTSDDVNIKYLHEEIPDPIAISIFLDTREEVICTVEMENPGRTFLKEMRWIIISSVLILLLLVFTFWYLVRVLFRQKSLEEMRSDFTHNITHELKTPIAVANAANDAMLNFGADKEPSKRIEYLTVVHNQLALLSDMVQRILSITSLEKGNYKISPSELTNSTLKMY